MLSHALFREKEDCFVVILNPYKAAILSEGLYTSSFEIRPDEGSNALRLGFVRDHALQFYLDLLERETVIACIDRSYNIATGRRGSYRIWYLLGLIHHFKIQGFGGIKYYKAVESLYEQWKKPEDIISAEDAAKCARAWQEARSRLISFYLDGSFEYFLISSEEREARVLDLVFEDEACSRVRGAGARDLVYAHRWFLSRYDIRSARILTREIRERERKGESKDEDQNAFKKPVLANVPTVTSAGGLPLALKTTESKRWLAMLLLLIMFGAASYSLQKVGWLPSASKYFWLAFLYVIPLVGTVYVVWKGGLSYQVYLPRLLCGTLIGYLFLMSNEAWEGSIALVPDPESGWSLWASMRLALRFFGPLILCFGYLYIEVNNYLKGDKGRSEFAVRRAWSIFLQGLFYALYLGSIFSDLFGGKLSGIEGGCFDVGASVAGPAICGCFGSVFIVSVVALAPLALFIGIFTQVFWEDRAITHPI